MMYSKVSGVVTIFRNDFYKTPVREFLILDDGDVCQNKHRSQNIYRSACYCRRNHTGSIRHDRLPLVPGGGSKNNVLKETPADSRATIGCFLLWAGRGSAAEDADDAALEALVAVVLFPEQVGAVEADHATGKGTDLLTRGEDASSCAVLEVIVAVLNYACQLVLSGQWASEELLGRRTTVVLATVTTDVDHGLEEGADTRLASIHSQDVGEDPSGIAGDRIDHQVPNLRDRGGGVGQFAVNGTQRGHEDLEGTGEERTNNRWRKDIKK